MLDPKWDASSKDRENTEPTRAIPNTDTAEPKRPTVRSDSDDPTEATWSTANEAPRRPKERSDRVDPRLT